MQRVVELARRFGVKTAVCINKYDLDEAGAEQIGAYCRAEGVEVAGRIPFDEEVVNALVLGMPAVMHRRPAVEASSGTSGVAGDPVRSQGQAEQAIRRLWAVIEDRLRSS